MAPSGALVLEMNCSIMSICKRNKRVQNEFEGIKRRKAPHPRAGVETDGDFIWYVSQI